MNTQDKVIKALEDNPRTRDNDNALFRAVISMTHDTNGYSYEAISKLQEEKVLPSHESMSRCRRKIQEHNPFLRGKAHQARQELAEEVRPLINTDFEQATMIY